MIGVALHLVVRLADCLSRQLGGAVMWGCILLGVRR